MYTKRIIPCLDVKDGRVVKGTNFVGLRDAGDPVELAARYDKERADELVFLDITASNEERNTMVQVAQDCAAQVFIPFTVGGGIRSAADMRRMLKAGADKTSLNTAAIKNPELIREGAETFGSQCVVLAVDARRTGEDKWEVFINGGRTPTGLDCIEWVKTAVGLGAGEILLTSMDADGTKDGYDIALTRAVSEFFLAMLTRAARVETAQKTHRPSSINPAASAIQRVVTVRASPEGELLWAAIAGGGCVPVGSMRKAQIPALTCPSVADVTR